MRTAAWVAGVLAAVAFVLLQSCFFAAGMSDFDLCALVGSRILSQAGPGAWIVGCAVVLIAGGVAGALYGAIFRVSPVANTQTGATLGLAHWMVAGILYGFIPEATSTLPAAPGFFALNYGGLAFVEVLILHLVFGAVAGTLYKLAVDRAGGVPSSEELDHLKPVTPLSDSLGQDSTSFDDYKKKVG